MQPVRAAAFGLRFRTGCKPVLRAARAGHTLLEVILALSICTILVGVLWTTIDVQLRATDAGRVNMEQAQLARAILRRIGDDLRSAVRYEPIDVASLVSVPELPAELTEALGGTGGEGSGTGGSVPGMEEETAEETAETAATAASSAEALIPPAIPGIYGDQYGIQIDVARLPRMDQYTTWQQNVGEGYLRDRASDLKTVAYFVVEPGRGSLSAAVGTGATSGNGGLVRRELDRAVTLWAAESGNLAMLDNTGELVAPEILALEFAYFDGTEWSNYWDSSEREGLPTAVTIAMAVGPPRTVTSGLDEEEAPTRLLISDLQTQRDSKVFIYRLTVHLPAGLPTEEPTAGATEEPAESEPENVETGTTTQGPSP